MAKRLTTKEFIDKAISIHGDRYDYSNVIYINSRTKVKIKCNICDNRFYQRPDTHLNNHGCPNCKKLDIKDFISKANAIHNNKYDYSVSIYTKSNIPMNITCPKHGVFSQRPNDHLSGKGCPKCANNYRKTTEDFIELSATIHHNKYTYSKTKYTGAHSKVIITCPTHGNFEQTANNHLRGQGCHRCRESKGENEISNYLESMSIPYIKEYKFKNCIFKRPLPFDFYLPEHNTCIEFDGEQHFIEKSFGSSIKMLDTIKRNDSIKNEYCYKNNIKLVRISYLELASIESILKEEL